MRRKLAHRPPCHRSPPCAACMHLAAIKTRTGLRQEQPANMRERAPRHTRNTPANRNAPAVTVPVTLRLVTPGPR